MKLWPHAIARIKQWCCASNIVLLLTMTLLPVDGYASERLASGQFPQTEPDATDPTLYAWYRADVGLNVRHHDRGPGWKDQTNNGRHLTAVANEKAHTPVLVPMQQLANRHYVSTALCVSSPIQIHLAHSKGQRPFSSSRSYGMSTTDTFMIPVTRRGATRCTRATASIEELGTFALAHFTEPRSAPPSKTIRGLHTQSYTITLRIGTLSMEKQ